MKLLLIRHGESQGNLQRRWQGWLDEPLTERGRRQAHSLADRLQPRSAANVPGIEAVYSSTLTRAVQTADILARRWSAPLVLDGRLRERNVGILQGLTWSELEARHPELAHMIREKWMATALPGGESTSELSERIWQAVQDIIVRSQRRANHACVAIVSHGGALNAFLNRLVGRADDMPFLFRLDNTSLSIVEVQNGRPRIVLVNDVCHLD